MVVWKKQDVLNKRRFQTDLLHELFMSLLVNFAQLVNNVNRKNHTGRENTWIILIDISSDRSVSITFKIFIM